MAEVSIIMSVYDESIKQLSSSIDSILQQSFKNFEFIVILDKPENILVKKYILERQKSDTRIIFIENKKNMKLGASLNRGIQVSQGKYIARMDGDDICNLDKLQKQFDYLNNHQNIDLLFTGWEEVGESGRKNIRLPSKEDFLNIKKTFFYKSPILHASMMCRREVFIHNLYPEIDRPEDFDLFLRLMYQGFTFGILEENLYSYYIQDLSIDLKYKKIKVFSSNYIKILYKNIGNFKTNIYFWWMFFIVLIQWLLSRNFYIFKVFFIYLQKIYKLIFH